MGFCYGQTGLKLLTSGDPPASGSQSAGIIGMSHRTWFINVFLFFFLSEGKKKKGVNERKKEKEKEGERLEMLLYSKKWVLIMAKQYFI